MTLAQLDCLATWSLHAELKEEQIAHKKLREESTRAAREVEQADLVPAYVRLLRDIEAEVRISSFARSWTHSLQLVLVVCGRNLMNQIDNQFTALSPLLAFLFTINVQILEGLLKLPENKQCADCKGNCGIPSSIMMNKRSTMGCISITASCQLQVRSATLDTWLPEQVAFIQSMGNEKANSYWEAELPPNYDRVGIENFICAKYEDKRWIPRNSTTRSHLQYGEEKVSEYKEKPDDRRAQGSINKADSPGEHKSPKQQGPKKTSLVVPKLPTPVFKRILKAYATKLYSRLPKGGSGLVAVATGTNGQIKVMFLVKLAKLAIEADRFLVSI
ncbi:arf-GAP with GTPase, ANK repeat and PH domain-containing protein 1-like [Asparagus officinalis]|uniref:arf-GAP with GTPase, ANK repeat and PH domain-containing protein 1-like n=1 Tax=Asparagus officinalis TaxID=4686 RepID=UPI00098E3159|nr:arf-GAP with GTPase, ANK repeat and PH domain-containing protein 1-like [Asparagus officinalis]